MVTFTGFKPKFRRWTGDRVVSEYDYESDSELLDSSCDEHAVSSDNDFVSHAILTRKGIREKMLNSANCDCVTWNCEKYDFI
jgi:hypothetical protein